MKRKAPGILPSSAWLKKNGHYGLVCAMWRNPDAFAHISQATGRKPIDHWLPKAETLARRHGGILPSNKYLQKNGFTGLIRALRLYPYLFSHILQHKERAPVCQRVEEATRLAKANGGPMPSASWLKAHGYRGIVRAIQRHPTLFAELTQEKKHRNWKEWVNEAEKLAEYNAGLLPPYTWLRGNAYNGLVHAIKKHPWAFAHIKQKRLRK